MLLSDGMGTGKKAYEDSRRLIETLEDLLEAGLSEEFALEMIQDALLFQDRKAFSTIDAAVISLKTGILKSGRDGYIYPASKFSRTYRAGGTSPGLPNQPAV